MMKKIIRKLFVDYEKEEKWLNDMASKGYNFIDYSFPGRYVFEIGKPGEYVYKIELFKDLPKHPESEAYINFMEENNIECVSTYVRWVYFRTKEKDRLVNLYSDNESKLAHYNRIFRAELAVLIMNLFSAIGNFSIGYINYIEKGLLASIIFGCISSFIVIALIPLTLGSHKKLKRIKKEKELYE